MSRRIRRPSSWSRRHSATSATTVEPIASTIAASLRSVGRVENRVSMLAENVSPGGAGPTRSVNTPTICGRRFGSSNPLRSGRPAGSVNPTNVAKVPACEEVISIRWHLGETTWARGTLAITTLRSVTSTRSLVTLTNSA